MNLNYNSGGNTKKKLFEQNCYNPVLKTPQTNEMDLDESMQIDRSKNDLFSEVAAEQQNQALNYFMERGLDDSDNENSDAESESDQESEEEESAQESGEEGNDSSSSSSEEEDNSDGEDSSFEKDGDPDDDEEEEEDEEALTTPFAEIVKQSKTELKKKMAKSEPQHEGEIPVSVINKLKLKGYNSYLFPPGKTFDESKVTDSPNSFIHEHSASSSSMAQALHFETKNSRNTVLCPFLGTTQQVDSDFVKKFGLTMGLTEFNNLPSASDMVIDLSKKAFEKRFHEKIAGRKNNSKEDQFSKCFGMVAVIDKDSSVFGMQVLVSLYEPMDPKNSPPSSADAKYKWQSLQGAVYFLTLEETHYVYAQYFPGSKFRNKWNEVMHRKFLNRIPRPVAQKKKGAPKEHVWTPAVSDILYISIYARECIKKKEGLACWDILDNQTQKSKTPPKASKSSSSRGAFKTNPIDVENGETFETDSLLVSSSSSSKTSSKATVKSTKASKAHASGLKRRATVEPESEEEEEQSEEETVPEEQPVKKTPRRNQKREPRSPKSPMPQPSAEVMEISDDEEDQDDEMTEAPSTSTSSRKTRKSSSQTKKDDTSSVKQSALGKRKQSEPKGKKPVEEEAEELPPKKQKTFDQGSSSSSSSTTFYQHLLNWVGEPGYQSLGAETMEQLQDFCKEPDFKLRSAVLGFFDREMSRAEFDAIMNKEPIHFTSLTEESTEEDIEAYDVSQEVNVVNKLLRAIAETCSPLLQQQFLVAIAAREQVQELSKEVELLTSTIEENKEENRILKLEVERMKKLDEERLLLKQQVEELKRKEENKAQKKLEKQRLLEEERIRQEEEAKRKAQEEAEARRRAEEELAARKKAEEEERKKAEEDAKKKTEEDAKRKTLLEQRAAKFNKFSKVIS